MNLSHAYGAPPPEAEAEALLREALDLGVTHFDTAALYGFGANESLVGRVLAPHRHRFVLASKCGHARREATAEARHRRPARDAEVVTCEQSLRACAPTSSTCTTCTAGTRQVPIEDSVGALADLVRAGKVREIGLSEVSAATLRRAHAVHPIAAVQTEYSLWTRNPEIAVLDACRELGAAFVAFSPLARGFLTGTLRDVATLDAKDLRRGMPRFAPEPTPPTWPCWRPSRPWPPRPAARRRSWRWPGCWRAASTWPAIGWSSRPAAAGRPDGRSSPRPPTSRTAPPRPSS
jgi:aryl-alcohol dehydrogenase-like predicted oxidoreductase